MKQTETAGPRLSFWRKVAITVGTILLGMGVNPPDILAQSECEDVSGAWAVNMVLQGGGPTEATVTLDQTNCEVTGFVEGRNKSPITNGTVKGSTATFTATANNQGGGTLDLVWDATVDGNDISGAITHPMVGAIEFTGKRVEG